MMANPEVGEYDAVVQETLEACVTFLRGVSAVERRMRQEELGLDDLRTLRADLDRWIECEGRMEAWRARQTDAGAGGHDAETGGEEGIGSD